MAIRYSDFRKVVFSDGEGAVAADFNDLQGYAEARIFDEVLQGISSNDGNGFPEVGTATAYTDEIFVLNAGQAYINAVAMTVVTTPGLILQRFDTPAIDGTLIRTSIPFTFTPANGVSLAVAASDPALNRRDLVEVKLEWIDDPPVARHFEDAMTGLKTSTATVKTRRVQATVQIKAGTPAASPTNPSPTTGFVKWAIVEVNAGVTSIAPTNVHACQMPMRTTCHNVHPYSIGRPGGTLGWAINAVSGANQRATISTPASAADIYAVCPAGWHAQRVVGVGIFAVWVSMTSAYAALGRYGINGTASTIIFEPLKVVTPNLMPATSIYHYRQANTMTDDNEWPIWTNGYGPHIAPYNGNPTAWGNFRELALKVTAEFAEVGSVKFFTAG